MSSPQADTNYHLGQLTTGKSATGSCVLTWSKPLRAPAAMRHPVTIEASNSLVWRPQAEQAALHCLVRASSQQTAPQFCKSRPILSGARRSNSESVVQSMGELRAPLSRASPSGAKSSITHQASSRHGGSQRSYTVNRSKRNHEITITTRIGRIRSEQVEAKGTPLYLAFQCWWGDRSQRMKPEELNCL